MGRHIFCITTLIAVAVAGFLILNRRACDEMPPYPVECSYGEAIAIARGMSDITAMRVFDVAQEEYGNAWHIEDGLARKVAYLGEEISYLRRSPSKRFIGFFHDTSGDERAGKDVALEVMDIETKDVTMVYEGDYKTSDWEWIDDDQVIVYHNCGSPCYSFTIMSTKGEALYGPRMFGLSYTLSPDKKWLLGSVDWNRTLGVSVMNIETKKEHEFIQAGIPNHEYAAYARAVWSADSRKLAVLNKQPDSEHIEAVVYDVGNDFRVLRRETAVCEIVDDDVRCDIGDNSPERFIASVLAIFGN